LHHRAEHVIDCRMDRVSDAGWGVKARISQHSQTFR
jgi:hypothetical protein